jgi:phosphohistidine phosphatase
MKYLTLIRHAKSSHKEAGMNDFDRPLNGRGFSDASLMGPILLQTLPVPETVLGSTAIRVQQTLQGIYESTEVTLPEPEWNNELYLADAETIWDFAYSAFMEFEEVWVCAHNPGITEAVDVLSGISIGNVPTLGVARIAFDEVVPELSVGDLMFYDVPKNHYR